ncbi:MAG: hypothetical protein NC321_09805 [Clostridium sp.]|nr:hypothetical protein [Clostridium sp.]
MSILLKDLLSEISVAICNANSIMEESALNQYMMQGFQKEGIHPDCYTPLTIAMSLPGQDTTQQIPVSALLHNTSMRLEQVDMKLKFKLFEENGDIKVFCMPDKAADETLNELTLQFKNTASAEGIARITDTYMKKI